MLAEGLVVHEQVHDVVVPGGILHPGEILLGREGIHVPALVGEAEGDVVGQAVVAEQEPELRLGVAGVDEVRALPAHDVAGALGEHRLEAEAVHAFADGVGVDELGVAEGGRRDAEQVLDGLLVLHHLVGELGLGGKGRQGVVIGLAQELHAAGRGQGAEAVNHVRGEALELLQGGAGDGERHLELALVRLDQLEQLGVHREIALLGDTAEDGPVGEVVIVVGVLADIEESVEPEPGGLMDLEIQADAFGSHMYCVFI